MDSWENAIAGLFEIHLTVATEGDRIAMLQSICAENGWKCLHIVLARGDNPSQPMITFQANGVLGDVLSEANSVAAELHAFGFPTTRVKVEATPWAAGVPQTDHDPHPPGGYFEHHIKLVLDRPPFGSLSSTAERHTAHLSRNALKRRADGREERFLTLRNFGIGRESAMRRLGQLLEDLRSDSHAWERVESEYCVYDSCLALDAGWLIQEENTHG